MTYKLQEIISKITSPVVLLIEGEERYQFNCGREAYEQDYDHYYLIDELYIKSGKIYIALRENNQTNDVNWCGEQEVSFF